MQYDQLKNLWSHRKKRKALCRGIAFATAVTMLAGCGATNGNNRKNETSVASPQETLSADKQASVGRKASEGEVDSVVVTMPATSEPEAGFDPIYGWGAGEHVHEPLIQSTLLRTTEDLHIEKELAEDFSVSEDGRTWTVKLRKDVVFSDGEPLTAEDVAFTYNQCRDNSSVNDFTMLKEAKADGKDTVIFFMNRPYSIWPYTMAIVGIVPEHAYDGEYGLHPVGSGRYLMKQWDKGQQVIFEANAKYYGEKPKIRKLTVLFMEEEAALAAALAGQVDVAHTAASYADQRIEGYHLLSVASVDNRGINLPAVPETEKDGIAYGNWFLSDVEVRRAINTGIDRQELIDHVLNGHGTPAYSICDKLPWYQPASKVSYDPEDAKKRLDQAGWKAGEDGIREKKGERAAFTILFQQDDSVRQALAEDLKNQLKQLGIEVTTEGCGWDTAYDRAQSQALVWGWGAHTPMELYNIYHTLPEGYAGYSPYANQKVDGLMDQALAESDLEASYELWKKAQWDGNTGVTQEGDIPWIWLCNVDHLYFVRDGLNLGAQKIHPHGHGWSIVNNVDQWSLTE